MCQVYHSHGDLTDTESTIDGYESDHDCWDQKGFDALSTRS